MPTPVALTSSSNNQSILDLQNSQLMDSPTVKQCFEAMKNTLRKRNIRINSINFSQFDETAASDSDGGELNTTVIPNVQNEANAVPVPVSNPSQYMTKEECIRLVEARVANLTKLSAQQIHNELSEPMQTAIETKSVVVDFHEHSSMKTTNHVPEDDKLAYANNNSVKENTNSFEFKIPQVPSNIAISTDRRRSVRLQENAEKRKSVTKLPSQALPPPPKRRRTTISKKTEQQKNIGHAVSKAEHCKYVLDLLNKGDMKAIQVLSQIGMKTAYCIIIHRSLNGKLKNFKEVSEAPFWRGKGWERFQMANNLR